MSGTRTETKYIFVVINHNIRGVSYKLALVMGTCHLPLQDAAAAERSSPSVPAERSSGYRAEMKYSVF